MTKQARHIDISASILSADCARLGEEVRAVIQAGVDSIHFDVMDMHYVPNLTFGALVLKALHSDLNGTPVHVHLMVNPVEALIDPFVEAGATSLVFHPGVVREPGALLDKIHQAGCQAGLALNPDEPLTLCLPYLEKMDRWLMMSVYPGLSGQAFIEASLDRFIQAKQLIQEHSASCVLEADGGIKGDNLATVLKTGLDSVVIGSGLFGLSNYVDGVERFRDMAQF